MVIKFETFESAKTEMPPQKGEYIIFTLNGNIILIEVISGLYQHRYYNSDDKMFKDSYFVKTIYLLYNIQSDIYYNFDGKYFFFSSGNRVEILWRGFNKDEALERNEILKSTEKYNL
ncbi:MAG: hypothetical protein K9J13_11250 [Saprospiraceae bacterium]|nr:hypothetical protein [Saprospiraceae bacterium]